MQPVQAGKQGAAPAKPGQKPVPAPPRPRSADIFAARARVSIPYLLVTALLCRFWYAAQPAAPEAPPQVYTATAADGRVFGRPGGRRAADWPRPSFEITPERRVLTVEEDPAPRPPVLAHVLYAALRGPRGERFACFMDRLDNGTHVCPGSDQLGPGDWEASVLLVRSPARNAPRHCRLAAAAAADAAGDPGNATVPLLDYIISGDFPVWDRYTACFATPMATVAQGTWRRGDAGVDWAAEAAAKARSKVCKGPGGPGVWTRYDPESPAGSVVGAFPEGDAEGYMNPERGLAHAFQPFGCRPRYLTSSEARQCAQRVGLALGGDSRSFHLALGFRKFMGPRTLEFINLYKPYHLGLGHFLASAHDPDADDGPAGNGTALLDAIRDGRTVVINSMLHDVAEFHYTTSRRDMERFWGEQELVECSAEPSPTCTPDRPTRCGCRKVWVLESYLESIRELKAEIKAAREEARSHGRPQPRVFWMSVNRRPPSEGEKQYPWQSQDILWELESAAAAELRGAGVQHIDLRQMAFAAPTEWWDDPTHFGKLDRKSLLLQATMQAILAAVC